MTQFSSIKSPSYEEALAKKIEKDKKKSRHPLKRATSPVVRRKPKKAVRNTTKVKTTAKLKKELDRLFSLYVRAIYPKRCYTCGTQSDRLQCGHYISRQYLVTRWDTRNCRPQCWGCNGYGKGQPLIFEENLKKEYGNDLVEEMKASRHQVLKLDRVWYEEQIHKYVTLLKTL